MRSIAHLFGSCLAACAVLGLTGCSLVFHPADRIDADGDGYFAVASLEELAGRTVEDMEVRQLDCDDGEDDVFPGAAELCDGLDNDCSRFFEGVDAGLSRPEQDQDSDGFSPCGFIEGDGVTDQEDCNDDPEAFGFMQAPNYDEVCGIPLALTVTSYNGPHPDRITVGLDDDCDPTTVETNEIDSDQDGHLRGCDRVSLEALHGLDEGEGSDHTNFALFDCVDDNAEVYPTVEASTESCVPGLENVWTSTCRSPANLTEAQRTDLFETWYPDFDRDGDGNIEEATWETDLCLGQRPAGFVPGLGGGDLANWIQEDGTDLSQAEDCDDLNVVLHRLDRDHDGFFSCGTLANGSDQDFVPGGVDDIGTEADSIDAAFPGGIESCDGFDNDLNGLIDEDFDLDVDGSYSDPAGAVDNCFATYATAVDCDDSDPSQNTLDQDNDGATTCDGDCNDFNSSISTSDGDGDGFTTCAVPPDCNDNDPTLYPDDVDLDGFDACPVGSTPADCDDANVSVFPGNGTQCDGIVDSDCDGVADPLETDADSDGYIECDDTTATALGNAAIVGGNDCDDSNPTRTPVDLDSDGFSTCTLDCDDTEIDSYPAAPLLCDGIVDNDCNGVLDPNEADNDGDTSTPCDGDCDDYDPTVEGLDTDNDGFTTCAGDCDDSLATGAALNPGVDVDGDGYDVCGAGLVPADCDDSLPNGAALNWNDADGDGASTCSTVPDCDDNDPTQNQTDVDVDGETTCDGDCDDSDTNVNTTASEGNVSNGIDDDCDGIADEGLVLAGDLAIVEIMIGTDAGTGDAFGEYLEVLNDSGTILDLRGWEVEITTTTGGGTTSFVFPADTNPANALDFTDGTRAVLARASTSTAYGSSVADFVWSATAFSNNGGTINLSAPTAAGGFTLIDTVTWTSSGCTASCASTSTSPTYGNAPASGSYWRPGFAMGLAPSVVTGATPATGNNSMSNWCEEQTPLGTADHGTPGAASTTASLVGGGGC
jgi:hypothetical protein